MSKKIFLEINYQGDELCKGKVNLRNEQGDMQGKRKTKTTSDDALAKIIGEKHLAMNFGSS